jgi:hypothetical protein
MFSILRWFGCSGSQTAEILEAAPCMTCVVHGHDRSCIRSASATFHRTPKCSPVLNHIVEAHS